MIDAPIVLKKRSPFFSYATSILLMFAVIVPLSVLFAFDSPSADDYSVSMWRNFAPVYLDWYKNLSGRYFTVLMLMLNPIHFGSLIGYRLVCASMFAIFLCSYFWFFGTLNKYILKIPKASIILLSTVMLTVYFDGLPSIVEGLFWFSGAGVYLFPLSLLLLLFCILTRIVIEPAKLNLVARIFCFVLVFAIAGANETLLGFLLLCLIAGLVIIRSKKPDAFPFMLATFGVAAFCALIAILAPGNYKRMAYFPDAHRVGSAIAWLKDSRLEIYGWAVNLRFLLFSCVVFMIFAKKARRHNYKINPIVATAIMGALLLLLYFPAYWAMGTPPPNRAKNVIFFVFLLSWTWVIYVVVQYVVDPPRQGETHYKKLRPVLLIVGVLVVMMPAFHLRTDSNILLAANDIRTGRAAAYSQQLQERYKMIYSSSEDYLTVPELRDVPKSIYYTDIGSQYQDWMNPSYAKYFGKLGIRVANGK